MPLSFDEGGALEGLPASEGPQVRENVDAGMHVIDLTAMRQQLEAARRPGGGG